MLQIHNGHFPCVVASLQDGLNETYKQKTLFKIILNLVNWTEIQLEYLKYWQLRMILRDGTEAAGLPYMHVFLPNHRVWTALPIHLQFVIVFILFLFFSYFPTAELWGMTRESILEVRNGSSNLDWFFTWL